MNILVHKLILFNNSYLVALTYGIMSMKLLVNQFPTQQAALMLPGTTPGSTFTDS